MNQNGPCIDLQKLLASHVNISLCECSGENLGPTTTTIGSTVKTVGFIFFPMPRPSSLGYREGFLWKRGRDNGQYLSRRFILSEREGVLKYFNKHDVSPGISAQRFSHCGFKEAPSPAVPFITFRPESQKR